MASARSLSRSLLVAAVVSFAASGARGETQVETYEVTGSSYAELIASMRANAPFVERTGQRHYGVTQVGFRPSWTFQPLRSGCELVSAKVDLELTVILPRWPGRALAPEALRGRWDELRADIEAHERLHSDMAETYHQRMVRALDRPRTAASCDRLNAVLTDEARRILERHRRAQRGIDAGGRNPATSG